MSYIKNLEENVKSVLTENEALAKEAAEFLGIEQEEAAARIKPLDFVEYVELANALQIEDEEIVRSILELPIDESMDERGAMCPVCSGGRREGYSNDCPNCGGEGYIEEGFFDADSCDYCSNEFRHGEELTPFKSGSGMTLELCDVCHGVLSDEAKKPKQRDMFEGFFDMFKRETRDEEVAEWAAAVMREYGRHKAASHIASMPRGKQEWVRDALGRYIDGNPKGEHAAEVSWVIRGYDALTEGDLPLLDKPTMSLKDIAEKHGVSLAELGSELAIGIKVELEHSNDRKIAKEIALDHLMELPDYYTRLDKMEAEGEADIEEEGVGVGGGAAAVGGEAAGVGTGKQPSKTGLEGAGKGIYEAKAGPFKSNAIGSRVKIVYNKDAWDKPIEPGVEGTITRAERVHTFSQMRPFVIQYTVETDDGQKIDIRREGVRKVKSVEEADNPYEPITPPSGNIVPGQEGEETLGRKSVDQLRPGDDIEVIDIDGDPTAVTVKNPNAAGDTLVVQTDKGEEHIVKKQAVSGTPTMEELQAAYEQALGEKGKWTRIKNTSKLGDKIKRAERVEKKKKLDHVTEVAPPGQEDWIKDRKAEFKKRYGDRWEEVLYATAWKRHNNESIEEGEEGEMKGLFVPVSADDRNTRLYPPRYIRRILDDHGVKIEGKTTVRPHPHADSGVVIRINGLRGVTDGRVDSSLAIAKDIYNKLRYVGYNVESYPTFVGGGVNVFISNENPDGRPTMKMDEAADKIKPINKMGYAPKAGSWKKRMHKAQPPENHEKTRKRHKKLHEDGWLSGVSDIRQMKPTRNHRPAIWENMLGTVFAMNDKYQVKGFDYDYEGARAFANLDDKQDKRVFRMPKLPYRPHWDKSKDEYERPLMVPRKGVAVLWVEDTNRVKPAAPLEEANPYRGSTTCTSCGGKGFDGWDNTSCPDCDGMGHYFVAKGDYDSVLCKKCRGKGCEACGDTGLVKEGQNAGKTEHSGAKKGKGAYYGRKKDAKRDSNKKRRENDKKAVDETARLKKLAGIQETASAGATGAGAVATGPVAVGDMQARPGMGIYDKPKRKKKKTKEEKGDGLGRSRKE